MIGPTPYSGMYGPGPYHGFPPMGPGQFTHSAGPSVVAQKPPVNSGGGGKFYTGKGNPFVAP